MIARENDSSTWLVGATSETGWVAGWKSRCAGDGPQMYQSGARGWLARWALVSHSPRAAGSSLTPLQSAKPATRPYSVQPGVAVRPKTWKRWSIRAL